MGMSSVHRLDKPFKRSGWGWVRLGITVGARILERNARQNKEVFKIMFHGGERAREVDAVHLVLLRLGLASMLCFVKSVGVTGTKWLTNLTPVPARRRRG